MRCCAELNSSNSFLVKFPDVLSFEAVKVCPSDGFRESCGKGDVILLTYETHCHSLVSDQRPNVDIKSNPVGNQKDDCSC